MKQQDAVKGKRAQDGKDDGKEGKTIKSMIKELKSQGKLLREDGHHSFYKFLTIFSWNHLTGEAV